MKWFCSPGRDRIVWLPEKEGFGEIASGPTMIDHARDPYRDSIAAARGLPGGRAEIAVLSEIVGKLVRAVAIWEFVSALALSGLAFAGAVRPASPAGLWLIEDGTGVIDIVACGAGFCGRIVGMKTVAPDGSAPNDYRGRSECGLEIMHEVMPGEAWEWTGDITNPDNGNVYGARLALDEQGRLHLRGFLRVPLLGAALGATQLWTAYAGTVTPDCRMEP